MNKRNEKKNRKRIQSNDFVLATSDFWDVILDIIPTYVRRIFINYGIATTQADAGYHMWFNVNQRTFNALTHTTYTGMSKYGMNQVLNAFKDSERTTMFKWQGEWAIEVNTMDDKMFVINKLINLLFEKHRVMDSFVYDFYIVKNTKGQDPKKHLQLSMSNGGHLYVAESLYEDFDILELKNMIAAIKGQFFTYFGDSYYTAHLFRKDRIVPIMIGNRPIGEYVVDDSQQVVNALQNKGTGTVHTILKDSDGKKIHKEIGIVDFSITRGVCKIDRKNGVLKVKEPKLILGGM